MYHSCRDPVHKHHKKQQAHKCMQKSRLEMMNLKKKMNRLEKGTNASTMGLSQIMHDSTFYADAVEMLRWEQGEPIIIKEVAYYYDDISPALGLMSSDNVISNIERYWSNSSYFQATDSDQEYLPQQPKRQFQNWQREVAKFQSLDDAGKKGSKLNIQKRRIPYRNDIHQRQLAQKTRLYKKIRRAQKGKTKLKVVERTKQFLAEYLQLNPYAKILFDIEKLLQYLPTQIPEISRKHRREIQQNYRFLEFCMFSILLNKKQEKRHELTKKFFRLSSEIEALVGLLDRNIYSAKKVWRFHYQELKPIVEKQLTKFWIYSQNFEDCPENAIFKMEDEDLDHFVCWMGQAIQEYEPTYCIKHKISEQAFAIDKVLNQNNKDQAAQVNNQYPTKSIKYYKSRSEFFLELKKQSFREFGIPLPEKKKKSEIDQNARPSLTKDCQLTRPRLLNMRKKCQEYPKRILFNTRVYLHFRPEVCIDRSNVISQREKMYELLDEMDPLCIGCNTYMSITENQQTKCLQYKCVNCQTPWTNIWRKVRQVKNYGVKFSLEGPTKKVDYCYLKDTGVRNNLHLHANLVRRAIYSQELPYNVSTKIPRFSNQTCLGIELNRQAENYLSLEVCDSVIPGAGHGLKVTQDVPKDTIIISYAGKIKPHYEVKADNNSIFCLGVIGTSAIVIDPLDFGNAGHFINTAYGKFTNCRAEMGMFQPRDQPLEPAIIIVSTKTIKAGSELFYSYGPSYGEFKENRNSKK